MNGIDKNESFEAYTLRKWKEIELLQDGYTRQIPSSLHVTCRLNVRENELFFNDSILDLLCFSLPKALAKYPKMNSRSSENGGIHYRRRISIGIAFDNGSNLKTLALNNADKMTLTELQNEIINLMEMYESGKNIDPELFNTTITVTDLSSLKIQYCVPVLTAGQAAIICLTRDLDDNFIIGCTYDHRVTEGRYVANFLNFLRDSILEIGQSAHKNDSNEHSLDILCDICQVSISEELDSRPLNRGLIVLRNQKDQEILVCRICFDGW